MRYHEAVRYLFDLRRFRSRPGTAATAALLEHLDDPQDEYAVVQVAGSNGKGSTARMTAAILREADLDVGLYSSPHLDDLRERVRVNGRRMPKRAVAAYVAAVREYVDERAAAGEAPTFFEVLTAMAYREFSRADVDVAIVEVGIGGRHDATSAADPVASAVTNVTLEHTDVLGDTIAEIARDKAAVAPPDRPLVTAATGEARAVLADAAGELLVVGDADDPDADVAVTYGGVANEVEGAVRLDGAALGDTSQSVETTIPLPGAHQAQNAGVAAVLARQAAEAVDAPVAEGDVARGLRSAHWPGRFEVISTEPLIVLDGAHNPAACERVATTLAAYEYDELTLVFGAMNDKDHAGMAAALPAADRTIVTQPAIDRAETRRVLERVFANRGGDDGRAGDESAHDDGSAHDDVESIGAVETAVEQALAGAGPDDCVLVTGSLYTVAEARTRWTRAEIPKRVDGLDDARAVLEGADVGAPGVWRMRGKSVHRVLKTRVRPRQAQYLKEEQLSLGGECAISSARDGNHEAVDVVLSGTLAQFSRLVEKLGAQPYGLDVVGERIRQALGIRVEGGAGPDATGYPWDDRTAVMGILNVTPDSFHDGGEYDDLAAAVERAEEMVADGADVIDVGGESTNPAADPISADEERDRILPVIEALAEREVTADATISVDTRKAAVAEAAVDAGADLINDVSGLEDPAMRFVAAENDVPVVVMHSLDAPVDPDNRVEYDDVVEDVIADLAERVRLAEQAGLDRSQIIVDPGLGFGKRAAESWELLGRLGELRALDCPIMVGHSHKSMLGEIDSHPDRGGYGTVAATALAAERGADVVRVHDVAENVAAVSAAVAAGRRGDDARD